MHQPFGGHEKHGPPGMPTASTEPGGAMTTHPVIPRRQCSVNHPSRVNPQYPDTSGRPGYNQPPAPVTGIYQQPQQYDQAQRRLDPDQMPNPISVIIENKNSAGGAFITNEQGLLPPLVTTKYVVEDQGNSSPRYVRSSLYCIPATADLLKTTALSITLTVSPMARTVEGEYEPPIVNFGELGAIRCNRCKAHMQLVDAGRRFQCLMCKCQLHISNIWATPDSVSINMNVLNLYWVQEYLCKKCLGTDSSQGIPQLISNINASHSIVDAVRTILGSRSIDKHIVDSSGKATISNDGATIMKLLDIVNPAVKL
ncbi:protein transport protein Sec24C-like [Eurosta solidaginis]|uniref:protein transport protein Sec24C-like n=1 Tax=Eurosta solidaginis TaxID=178769 RepID=UPI0035308DAC